MNNKVETYKPLDYDSLNAYINDLNKRIKELDEEKRKDFLIQTRKNHEVFLLLGKEELLDSDLALLNKMIRSSFFEVNNVNRWQQNVFEVITNHILIEKQKTDSVREELFSLLETVVAREDFSLFDCDENIDCFKRLYRTFRLEHVNFHAILNYLTSKDNMSSSISKSLNKCGFADVKKRIKEFCGFLEKMNIKIYVYQYQRMN